MEFSGKLTQSHHISVDKLTQSFYGFHGLSTKPFYSRTSKSSSRISKPSSRTSKPSSRTSTFRRFPSSKMPSHVKSYRKLASKTCPSKMHPYMTSRNADKKWSDMTLFKKSPSLSSLYCGDNGRFNVSFEF